MTRQILRRPNERFCFSNGRLFKILISASSHCVLFGLFSELNLTDMFMILVALGTSSLQGQGYFSSL